jgi:hypothetical protein
MSRDKAFFTIFFINLRKGPQITRITHPRYTRGQVEPGGYPPGVPTEGVDRDLGPAVVGDADLRIKSDPLQRHHRIRVG